jgi:hypothetical protein
MFKSMSRRELLTRGTILGAGFALCRPLHGQSVDPVMTTYTYKTVRDLAIQADVYRPPDRALSGRPWCGSTAGR